MLNALQMAAGVVRKNDEGAVCPSYTLHDYRHAAASLWIDRGVNAKRVQTWMGHSSIQVTFDTYGHLFDNPTRDAAVADAIEQELTGDDEDATWMLQATWKPQFPVAF